MKTEDVFKMLDILELALQHGVPAVQGIIKAWDSDAEVTPEMVASVKAKIKPADDLFDDIR